MLGTCNKTAANVILLCILQRDGVEKARGRADDGVFDGVEVSWGGGRDDGNRGAP